MPLWLRLVLAILVLFGLVSGAAVWIGTMRWNTTTAGMIEKMAPRSPEQGKAEVSLKNIDKLPAPVIRYFRMALREGQPLVRFARITHQGEFLTNPQKNGWGPFTSTQSFSADPAGFVWDASIRFAPFLNVRVRDSYIAGKAAMEASAFAFLPIMNEGDKTELNQGALQRYLAESVWFPTRLLPGQGVAWSAIDNARALATFSDSGTKVSLEFTFNEKGEITRIFSPGRYREVDRKYELTPWVVQLGSYGDWGGMRIPLEGEASWQLPGGPQPYWKGKIVDAQYDFVK